VVLLGADVLVARRGSAPHDAEIGHECVFGEGTEEGRYAALAECPLGLSSCPYEPLVGARLELARASGVRITR
jgi:hypothetical protein